MEGFYLADRKFVAGNSISIADLLYSCELDEMQLLDGVEQVGFLARPHVCTCNAPTAAFAYAACKTPIGE